MGEMFGSRGGRALEGRMVGHGASADGRYSRLVERFTLHPQPLDFRSLCARVVRPETRYLLLDLDRTTHRGLNLGELLGWEIASYRFFGAEVWRSDAPRVRGRLLSDPQQPQRLPRYLLDGARRWAFPGLSYLLWAKLAAKNEFLERWSYRKFGSEPVRAVQRLPQTALLHDLATLPKSTLRELAQRVWDLAAPVQVIEHADLDWLRARCPNLRIILTSASPQPMVEVAGEMLGVNGVEFSVTRDLGDRYASPYWVDRRFALGQLEQLATPREVRINSGHAKIERLLERYPDLLDQGVESVGISDTGYGEDHAWAQYFSVVVDVNSTAPFPPLVAHDSPLREVHSAQLLTREERQRAHPLVDAAVQLRAEQFGERLAVSQDRLEKLCAEAARIGSSIAAERNVLLRELERERTKIGTTVTRFNEIGSDRTRLLGVLRRQLRGEASVQRKLALLERPLSYAFMAIAGTLRGARAELGLFAQEQPRELTAPTFEVEAMLEASLA